MDTQQIDSSKPNMIEMVFPTALSPRQCRIHGCRIVRLLERLADEQSHDGLSALLDGDIPEMPFRISVDFRHAPAITELASGAQLIAKEGHRYSRDEVIRLLRQTMLLSLLDDILVDGESIKPARRTSFFNR